MSPRIITDTVQPVRGITLGTAGLHTGTDRLTLLAMAPGTTVSAVFTRNSCCAAPIHVARQHLHDPAATCYCLINAGNANAGTGAAGIQDCLQICAWLAQECNCAPQSILPFSTGIIGERLPMEPFRAALPGLCKSLQATAWQAAAQAILTTDTVPKLGSTTWQVAGSPACMTGMVKGAGMIRPDMATLLAFIATDVAVASDYLQDCLGHAVDRSFNRMTVDGDCSTNDAVVLIATGQGPRIDADTDHGEDFRQTLEKLCKELALMLMQDGEGVTRVMEVCVTEGLDEDECTRVAYRIAESPLVKAALHSADPNWGRILAAIGAAGITTLDLQRLCITIGDTAVFREGAACVTDAAALSAQLSGARCNIQVRLGRGTAHTTILGCDLSCEYVRINAHYRS